MNTKFSNPLVPFEVGTWLRANAFDITTVRVSRGLDALQALQAKRDDLEKQIEAAEKVVKDQCAIADQKMRAKDAK